MTFPASLVETLNRIQVQLPTVAGPRQPITIRSIGHFCAALAWAWLLLASFTGWGRLTGNIFRVRRLPVAVACSLGIAAVIFVGGWLNLLRAIYPQSLLALVIVGIALYFLFRKDRPPAYVWTDLWHRSPRWAKVLLVLALVVMALRVAGTVRLSTFNSFDDGPAYMVFPQKMLAAHRFAFDPFSDRRLISSLGGAYLLQGMVIVATSLTHVGMADRTLGLFLLFPAVLELGIAFGLAPLQIAAMEAIVFLVPQETWNLSFIVLPVPLLLSFLWVVFAAQDEEVQWWRRAVLAGLISGAILSLKSSFLPYVAMLILASCFVLPQRKLKRAIQWLIATSLATLLVMAAWMISMKLESGTFLFPVLGGGVDYSSYGLFHAMSKFTGTRAIVRSFVQGIVLAVLAGIQYFAGIQDRRSKFSFGVLVAAAVAITAFNIESGGDYIWRYNFAQFFTAIIVFAAADAAAYSHRSHSTKLRLPAIVAMLSLVGCIFYYDVGGLSLSSLRQIGYDFARYRCDVHASLSGQPLVTTAMSNEYRAAQASIPAKGIALESVSRPFLLNYRADKTIYLADWPGGASPRPGWNFNAGGSGLAAYLAGQGVRYVMFDYRSPDSVQFCSTFANLQHYSQLDHRLELLAILAHHQFDQIRATHASIYDDGKIAVIDLQSAITSTHSVLPDWTLNTSEAEMCSQIARKYIATHASTASRKTSPCD